MNTIQEEETPEEEEGEEGENNGEKDTSKKSMTFLQRKTLKRMKTTDYSMNSINVENIRDEDMLTYVKMKRLKNLFNVCKRKLINPNLKPIVKS